MGPDVSTPCWPRPVVFYFVLQGNRKGDFMSPGKSNRFFSLLLSSPEC